MKTIKDIDYKTKTFSAVKDGDNVTLNSVVSSIGNVVALRDFTLSADNQGYSQVKINEKEESFEKLDPNPATGTYE